MPRVLLYADGCTLVAGHRIPEAMTQSTRLSAFVRIVMKHSIRRSNLKEPIVVWDNRRYQKWYTSSWQEAPENKQPFS